MVTNDETTGRVSVCTVCGQAIEEALLLKGLMVRRSKNRRAAKVPSPGIPTWRTLDRGAGSARCRRSSSQQHVPGASAAGTAFQA